MQFGTLCCSSLPRECMEPLSCSVPAPLLKKEKGKTPLVSCRRISCEPVSRPSTPPVLPLAPLPPSHIRPSQRDQTGRDRSHRCLDRPRRSQHKKGGRGRKKRLKGTAPSPQSRDRKLAETEVNQCQDHQDYGLGC